MADAALPGIASGRLRAGEFGSGLSTADLSSTIAAGLEPVGIVQGTCVLKWSWYGPRSPYGGSTPITSGTRKLKKRHFEPRGSETGGISRRAVRSIVYLSGNWSDWACQHNMNRNGRGYGQHEPGVNFEQRWVGDLWAEGFATARARMVAEAELASAHGIVGVVDLISTPTEGVKEFVLRGTAVRVRGADAPREIWSTYLAGERLIKLVEAGWAPISVVAALASMRIWPSCTTEDQLAGRWPGSVPITQLANAHYVARSLARTRVHNEAGPDDVHGVRYEVAEHRIAHGDDEVTCTVWGSRIRRYAPLARQAAPMVTVSLK